MIKQCLTCEHFDSKKSLMPMGSCKAFKRIPRDILERDFDHTKKYPGQTNNILYKKASKK